MDVCGMMKCLCIWWECSPPPHVTMVRLLTFLSWASGESDRKLEFTSSRSEPLEPAEVTLSVSPLSTPPPWYSLKWDWSNDLEWELPALLQLASVNWRLEMEENTETYKSRTSKKIRLYTMENTG